MAVLRLLQRIIDFCLTVLLWAYFLFGYFFILLFLFVPSYIHLKKSDAVLQKMNYVHLKCFFFWVGFLALRTKFTIDADVRRLRSSIIVCNHISYLDPIALVSLFPRQTTIVKNTFFSVPIFGWFLKKAGYVPSSPSEMYGPAMINHLESIKRHLAAGGNLFVFPEGTRGRGGKLAPFNKGVFSIARYCNTGLALVFIRDTDKLFRPGTFSFNMLEQNDIRLELIAKLAPDYQVDNFSINALADQARQIFERKIADVQTDKGAMVKGKRQKAQG
jgi:1-acyl-sn-glycerol-3-phosphate acyltransferase